MTCRAELQRRLADALTSLAAACLSRQHPEWAEAILSENASLDQEPHQLAWALGALRASFLVSVDAAYLAVLALAVLGMGLYQWSADESVMTLLVMCTLGLCLGCLKPNRFLLSGVAVGVVVAAVNGFERLTGIRPAYETHQHSFARILAWSALVLPATISSAFGRRVGLKLTT